MEMKFVICKTLSSWRISCMAKWEVYEALNEDEQFDFENIRSIFFLAKLSCFHDSEQRPQGVGLDMDHRVRLVFWDDDIATNIWEGLFVSSLRWSHPHFISDVSSDRTRFQDDQLRHVII